MTPVHRLCDAKSEHKENRSGSMFFLVSQRGGDIKNKQTGQKTPYNWILQHPHIVQYPIANDCIKLSIYSQVGP